MILLNGSFEVLTHDEKTGKVQIHDPLLKRSMETKGIDIPAFLQESYNNQSKVKLGDPLFFKAFKEVHWAKNMNTSVFVWKKKA